MRNYLKTGVFGLILAAMALTYFITKYNVPPEQARYIYSLGKKEITELSIKNTIADIGFAKKNGQWVITSPAEYKADLQKMGIIESWLKAFPVERVIKEDRSDSSSFGFDNPEITVKFKLDSGEEHALLVGNPTASRAQRYVKDASRPYIYLVSIAYISQFEGRLSSFRAKNVIDVNKDAIGNIQYKKDGKTVIGLSSRGGEWYIDEPFDAKANDVYVSELLVNLRDLKAIDYVEDTAPDLKKLGFEPVIHTLTIKDSDGREQVLEFGNPDGNGFLYMRTGSRDDIIKVFAEEMKFDSYTTQKLLFEAPLMTSIDNVSKIIVEDRGSRKKFDVDSVSSPPSFTCDGKLLKIDDLITFYVKYIRLMAKGYEPWTPMGEPEMVLISHLKDGSSRKLELYVRNADTYYMRVNDENIRFYTDAEQVEQVRKWMDRLQ